MTVIEVPETEISQFHTVFDNTRHSLNRLEADAMCLAMIVCTLAATFTIWLLSTVANFCGVLNFVTVRVVTKITKITVYNWSSNKGPSEKGTLYVNPLYRGHCLGSQKLPFPIVFIHWEPPRRGQPLYKGQNSWIYIVPKISFVWMFDCINIFVLYYI